MSQVRCHALVLRNRDFRESDKLITILSKEAGKISLVAKGTKKVKSRFAALVEPLTLGTFLLHEGKGLHTLIQGEIIKSYGTKQNDLLLLAYSQYLCELCEKSLPEGEPAVGVFTLLLAALEILSKETNPARLARCFELNLLDELGYRPSLDNCQVCGTGAGPFSFHETEAAVICQNCAKGTNSFVISGAALATMRHFLKQGFHRISVCHVSKIANGEILRVVKSILKHNMGLGEIKSFDFVQNLEDF